MIIQIDTRQKPLPHNRAIEQYFISNGHRVIKSKMLVGDYCIPNKTDVCIDTKQGIDELYTDLITEHRRFKEECKTARDCGIKLYVVTANKFGITDLEHLTKWDNPRISIYERKKRLAEINNSKKPLPPPTNETLIKIARSMTAYYGVTFLFCDEHETGRVVLSLLTEQSA